MSPYLMSVFNNTSAPVIRLNVIYLYVLWCVCVLRECYFIADLVSVYTPDTQSRLKLG